MQKFIRCRLSTAVPSYAIDLLSKPTKKYPAKAQSKLETVSSLESGIRLATVEDFSSPISSLSLVISAGPRYQSDNKERGFSQWIKNHGFKSTNHRSTIRITREADIKGNSLSSSLTREHLIFNAEFMRDDLQDVVEAYQDILDGMAVRDTKQVGIYAREFVRKSHEWHDTSHDTSAQMSQLQLQDPSTVLFDRLHRVAFRHGLGNELYPMVAEEDFNIDAIHQFIQKTFIGPQIALVGYGVNFDDLASFSRAKFPPSFLSGKSEAVLASKYFGGDAFDYSPRINGKSHVAIAYPGASIRSAADAACATVLKHLLGPRVIIQNSLSSCTATHANSKGLLKSSGGCDLSAFNLMYSDNGLFGVVVSGSDASALVQNVRDSVKTLRDIASGKNGSGAEVKSAVAAAKHAVASSFESSSRMEKILNFSQAIFAHGKVPKVSEWLQHLDKVTAEDVSKFVARAMKSKPSVSALGDVDFIPRSEEL